MNKAQSARATKREIAALDEAIRQDPLGADDLSLKWFLRGLCEGDLGRFDTAIHDFDMAIIYDSQAAEAYYWRAVARHQIGDYKRAIKDYTKVIALDPEHRNARGDRALASLAKIQDRR